VRFTGNSWQTRSNLLLNDGRRLFAVAYDPVIQRLYAHYQAETGQWFVDTWKPEPWPALWGMRPPSPSRAAATWASPRWRGGARRQTRRQACSTRPTLRTALVSVVASGGAALVDTLATGEDPFAVAADGTANRVRIGLREPGRLIDPPVAWRVRVELRCTAGVAQVEAAEFFEKTRLLACWTPRVLRAESLHIKQCKCNPNNTLEV
jgi:hypothetical protein